MIDQNVDFGRCTSVMLGFVRQTDLVKDFHDTNSTLSFSTFKTDNIMMTVVNPWLENTLYCGRHALWYI